MKSRENIEIVSTRIKELGSLKNELGKLEGVINLQEKTTTDFTNSNDELDKIMAKIKKEIDSVLAFEIIFKKKFKEITKLFHDEEYSFNLNFNASNGNCSPQIDNIAANPEGGKKKAEVIAFDFAYISSIHSNTRPNFIFHDSIEDIDKKQIKPIFEYSNLLKGQQILSILSDKLPDEIYDQYISEAILVLSEENMFFKV